MSTNQNVSLWVYVVAIIAVFGVIRSPFITNKSGSYTKTTETPEVNIFKNEVLSMINATSMAYSDISMSVTESNNYFSSSDDDEYAGMCITLDALVSNGYLDKNITNYGGLFLVEVPYDGGITSYTSWVHNGEMGINGVEKQYINRLLLNNNSTGNDKISGGGVEVTNDLKGIKNLINQVKNNSTITITSPLSKGGTGKTYSDIRCITDRLY